MKISIGSFINAMIDEGHADMDVLEQAADVLEKDSNAPTWYIQSLMGCGGWIAALFFFFSCGSLFLFTLFDSDDALPVIIIGLLMVIVSTASRYASKNLALSQFLLVVHIVGQIIFFTGVVMLSNGDSPMGFGMALALLNVVVLAVYPDNLVRFLAAVAVYSGLVIITADMGDDIILTNITILGGVSGAVTLTIFGGLLQPTIQIRYRDIWQPLGYASAGAMVVFLVGVLLNFSGDVSNSIAPIIAAMLMLALSLWAVVIILQSYDVPLPGQAFYAAGGLLLVVGLLTINTPGVLGGLLLILLGQRSRDGILLTLGYAALTGFVVYYYYNLSATLLVKSFIMMATGAVLLGGRFALRMLFPVPDKSKEAI